jgi:hypothetical protein
MDRRGDQHVVVDYGQLRRNTDRRTRHRHAALCLATTVLIIGRLIDWRDRWNAPEHLSAQVLRRRFAPAG